jgi:NAD(P)-dependent dehydrogenase (short-subunit alcohol dehydrogenase family)
MPADRVILITGATDGLGRRVAEKLAAPGLRILVHGRDAARGAAVVASVERAGGAAQFFAADLSALAGVRALAHAVQAEHARLDAVVNNAGIARLGGRRDVSADGIELHFAVNYLAPFLLLRLLRPQLGEDTRVINVVSAGQSPIDFDDVMLERGYDGFRAYAQSKLAGVMLTFDLAQAWDAAHIKVDCLHPATLMDTAMVREAGLTPSSSIETGAAALLALITPGPGAAGSGRYFDGLRAARPHAQAYDVAVRRRLNDLSLALLNLEP